MSKLNHHQFRQALGALIGQNPNSSVWTRGNQDDPFGSDHESAVESGLLSCPASLDSVFIVPERIPVFTDMRMKTRSQLVQILLDRPDDTALVVDSCLTGKDALFYAALVLDITAVESWLHAMNPYRMSLTLRPIDEQYKIMIMSLSSFVFSGAS